MCSIISRWRRWRFRKWRSRSSRTGAPSGNCPPTTAVRARPKNSPPCANGCGLCWARRSCCQWSSPPSSSNRVKTPESESFETALPADTPTPAPSAPQASSFRLWGLIGVPGVSRATREDQFVFVNRRPVENRGINFALLEGYHTALMKGRYPVVRAHLGQQPVRLAAAPGPRP